MDRNTGRGRLKHLREINEAVAEAMAGEAPRFERIAGADAPRVVESFNLFETPTPIAERMAEIIGSHARGGRVLEPSAGLGRLVRAALAWSPGELVAVEQSPQCCAELYRAEGFTLKQRDYLECSVADLGGLFDAVIMNPPFKQGRDIRHIIHARAMLKPGGLLVALCLDGARQGDKLRPMCDTWEALPAGSFKQAGTRAGAVMLTLTA